MLLSMKELLDHANKENYAIAAPNVSSELDARAAIEAAEELYTPIILDVAEISTPDIVFFGRYLSSLCQISSVPIALNLDHGKEFKHAILAIRGGFTSIMVDRSTLPYEENVRQVKELERIAHSIGISVEAELGCVGYGINEKSNNESLTDPEQAKRFIDDTGIDCLAIAIGTTHGSYIKEPKIDFDRLVKIKQETNNFPLVLHGGSGCGEENIKKVCKLGINKINVANELFQGACKQLLSADLTGNGAYELWNLAKKGYKETLKKLIVLYGSEGKAWVTPPTGIGSKEIVLKEE